MNQLAQYIVAARIYLESFHPALPAAILVACIWLTNYLVRRFLPTIWETIANIPFGGGIHRPAVELARKAWQALPSVATGALLAAISTGNATDAVVGAILGLIAPVWHEALKALPVPYRGGRPPATTPPLVVEDPPISLPPNPAPSMFALRDEITSVEQPIPQRPSDRPPKP